MWREYRVAISSAILVVAGSTAANSGGYSGSIKDAPPPAEVYQWNGLSVGVGLGAGLLDRSVSVDAEKTAEKKHQECYYSYYYGWSCSPWETVRTWESAASSTFNNDDWQWFGTLQVGYDRLIHDRLLVGAFADIDFYMDGDSGFSAYERHYGSHSWIDGDFNLDNVWSVGGRLGFLVSPRLLVYGVGGYTQARIDGTANATFQWGDGPAHTVSMDFPDELQGWFVGGGAEVKIHKNVSLKFEYRYSRFGTETVSAHGEFPGTAHGYYSCNYHCYDAYKVDTEIDAKASIDADIHSARVALVLRLDDLHDRHHEPLK